MADITQLAQNVKNSFSIMRRDMDELKKENQTRLQEIKTLNKNLNEFFPDNDKFDALGRTLKDELAELRKKLSQLSPKDITKLKNGQDSLKENSMQKKEFFDYGNKLLARIEVLEKQVDEWEQIRKLIKETKKLNEDLIEFEKLYLTKDEIDKRIEALNADITKSADKTQAKNNKKFATKDELVDETNNIRDEHTRNDDFKRLDEDVNRLIDESATTVYVDKQAKTLKDYIKSVDKRLSDSELGIKSKSWFANAFLIVAIASLAAGYIVTFTKYEPTKNVLAIVALVAIVIFILMRIYLFIKARNAAKK